MQEGTGAGHKGTAPRWDVSNTFGPTQRRPARRKPAGRQGAGLDALSAGVG